MRWPFAVVLATFMPVGQTLMLIAIDIAGARIGFVDYAFSLAVPFIGWYQVIKFLIFG